MSVRHLIAVVGVAAVVAAVPLVPSYAADPTDLYVATVANGGDDSNDCTSGSPCATVARAIDQAGTAGTTIHVGAGTFDGQVIPGAKAVAIEGDSIATTTLTATGVGQLDVVELSTAGSSLSNLAVSGGIVGVLVEGTAITDLTDVELSGSTSCLLAVAAGVVHLTDSVLQNAGSGDCSALAGGTAMRGAVAMVQGGVTLSHSQILTPAADTPGVTVAGGSFYADQTVFDDTNPDTNGSHAIEVTGGSANVTRSSVHGFDTGVLNGGGDAQLSDDTFVDNVVGVTGAGGSTTVVRSTLTQELASLQTELGGTLGVAGSVLGSDSIENCNGSVTDLGYNLAEDESCSFTATTSQQDVDPDLDTGLSDVGGLIETVAIRNPSAAVDLIPADATYGSGTTLCPGAPSTTTDIRGVPRPAGAGCDVGSMELAGTTTTFSAPARSAPHQAVLLTASVSVPDVGVDGIGITDGTVAFRDGAASLCQAPVDDSTGRASCSTTSLATGKHHLSAAYYPAAGTIVDSSAAPTRLIRIGTAPAVSGPHKVVVHVGSRTRIVLHAAGKPTPTFRLVKGKAPRGLTLTRKPGKVTLTGRPAASSVGRHVLTLKAVNLMGHVTRTLTIVVRRG